MRLDAALSLPLTLADDPPSSLCDLRAAPLLAREPDGAVAVPLAGLSPGGEPDPHATVQAALAAIGRGPERGLTRGLEGVELRGLPQAIEAAGAGEALLSMLLARLMEELVAGGVGAGQPWAAPSARPSAATRGAGPRRGRGCARVASPALARGLAVVAFASVAALA